MNEIIQVFSDNLKTAVKMDFKGENLIIENLSSDQIGEVLNQFILTSVSLNDSINIDIVDIRYFIKNKELEFILVEIDHWKDNNDFNQKIDKVAKYIKPTQDILCVIESGNDIQLDNIYYITKMLDGFTSEDGGIIFGINFFEHLLGCLKLFIFLGK
ncbi:hypothetical protein PTQ27_01635 [Mannheimia sp. AT1]|uniref:Uncharacterized protein n=1 Tax=Mannheimia cairinae TaxID=3025936 RepID=A0ABT5MQP7_9PAST|nr:hypothetical protein [Mannheimia cairinae]MDD0823177.1 hypothetical protein [Mannheimia cairinae]MDD0825798.1 hypothetical protein [Mannheimia cairinae]